MKLIYTLLDTTEYSDVERYIPLLPRYRRERIERARFEADKLLSLSAGLLIRSAAGDSQLVFNEHEKPYAKDSDIFFSVSHSGMCAAIAVDSAEVGLDVERIADRDYMSAARRYYHPAEYALVENSDDCLHAFYRIWTRKEAFLKREGTGIAARLNAFDSTSKELSGHILSFELSDYAVSVCSAGTLSMDDIEISRVELKDLI